MTIHARRTVKDAIVWKGGQKLLVRQKVVRALGVPIGREDYVKNQLAQKNEEHQVLINRILLVQDLQSAWLLLFHCAGSLATFRLRSVRPPLTTGFSDAHDRQMWECFSHLVWFASLSSKAQQYTTIPLSLGGTGLSCGRRSRESAHWSSWADSLPTVRTMMIQGLNVRATPTFHAVRVCSDRLQRAGSNPPTWDDLAKGELPPEEDVGSKGDRNIPKVWQKASTRMVEQAHFSAEIRPQLTEPEVALWRSQHGPLASVPFVAFPADRAT